MWTSLLTWVGGIEKKWIAIAVIVVGLSSICLIQHLRIEGLKEDLNKQTENVNRLTEAIKENENTIKELQSNIEGLKDQVKTAQKVANESKQFAKRQTSIFKDNKGGPTGVDNETRNKLIDDFNSTYSRLRK